MSSLLPEFDEGMLSGEMRLARAKVIGDGEDAGEVEEKNEAGELEVVAIVGLFGRAFELLGVLDGGGVATA